jgi:predicted SAM-dependent methyltransferase
MRVNIGCGQTPTPGWRNYDNSWSIFLAKFPIAASILAVIGLINADSRRYVDFIKKNKINFADGVKHIPEKDNSVEVLYSSHMLEHLDREEAKRFLIETYRVLKSGGILRVVVPDIRFLTEEYFKHGDADVFIKNTLLARPRPKTMLQKIKYLIIGDRNHQWMYDGKSLCSMIASAGFIKVTNLKPGETAITDSAPLDLLERVAGSVVVEAVKP